jgi:hypothetical protein
MLSVTASLRDRSPKLEKTSRGRQGVDPESSITGELEGVDPESSTAREPVGKSPAVAAIAIERINSKRAVITEYPPRKRDSALRPVKPSGTPRDLHGMDDTSIALLPLTKLFELLAAQRIQPRIAARLPLLAGREAERLLEAGGIAGKIVLLR